MGGSNENYTLTVDKVVSCLPVLYIFHGRLSPVSALRFRTFCENFLKIHTFYFQFIQ